VFHKISLLFYEINSFYLYTFYAFPLLILFFIDYPLHFHSFFSNSVSLSFTDGIISDND